MVIRSCRISTEKALHKHFSKSKMVVERIDGGTEWFEASDAELQTAIDNVIIVIGAVFPKKLVKL
jgi:hypothetical protein